MTDWKENLQELINGNSPENCDETGPPPSRFENCFGTKGSK